MTLDARGDQRSIDDKKTMDEFAKFFPLAPAEELPSDEISEVKFEVFYLWDTKIKAYEIYKILRFYLTEYYGIDSTILVELVKDFRAPVTQTLYDIPFIHASYVDVLVASEKNGRSDTSSQNTT